jgi:hypothetical protein
MDLATFNCNCFNMTKYINKNGELIITFKMPYLQRVVRAFDALMFKLCSQLNINLNKWFISNEMESTDG